MEGNLAYCKRVLLLVILNLIHVLTFLSDFVKLVIIAKILRSKSKDTIFTEQAQNVIKHRKSRRKKKLLQIILAIGTFVLKLWESGTHAASQERPAQVIPTGAAIHIFPRYGYLHLSMRVVPRNESHLGIFLEPVRNVFLPSTIAIEEKRFISPDNALPIHNEFHIDLCEDLTQLIRAYFKKFSVQGLDKPWQAFSAGWRTPSLSKYFGIDPSFIVGDYRYMLVRIVMVKNAGVATPLRNVTATPEVQQKIEAFERLGIRAAYNFTNEVGTHYIHSHLSGNAIYQVFVYDAFGFEAIKRRLSEFNFQNQNGFVSLLPRLLPLWGKQIGKLFVLSANTQVSNQVQQALLVETVQGVTVPNIFKLQNNPNLLRQVELMIRNEPPALLGMELKAVDVLFKDQGQRNRFVQLLKDWLQLWEINSQ